MCISDIFWSIFFQFFYHHSFLLRFLNSSGTQNFENFIQNFYRNCMFWINFELFEILISIHLSTVWGCFINWPQKYPHFEKYPFCGSTFIMNGSYRFPHRNHYGHHFNHVSNPSHEQFLFENRAVEADVPHNADGANGSIKRMIWIYNCITCYSEICTAVKITARRTW